MKKTLLFLCVIIALTTKAQINKGAQIYGGTIALNSSNTTGASSNKKGNVAYNVTPSYGVAISKNRVVGGFVSIAGGKNEDKTNGVLQTKTLSSLYGLGYFERRYINLTKRFYYFTDFNAGIYTGKSNSETGLISKNKQTSLTFGAGLSPAIAYALTNRCHLEFLFNNLVSVNATKSNNEQSNGGVVINKTSTNSFSLSSNLNPETTFNALQIGFRILINK
jgi:hypothetical protein